MAKYESLRVASTDELKLAMYEVGGNPTKIIEMLYREGDSYRETNARLMMIAFILFYPKFSEEMKACETTPQRQYQLIIERYLPWLITFSFGSRDEDLVGCWKCGLAQKWFNAKSGCHTKGNFMKCYFIVPPVTTKNSSVPLHLCPFSIKCCNVRQTRYFSLAAHMGLSHTDELLYERLQFDNVANLDRIGATADV